MKIETHLKILKPNQKNNQFFQAVDILPDKKGGYSLYINIMNKLPMQNHNFMDINTNKKGLGAGVKKGDEIHIEIYLKE